MEKTLTTKPKAGYMIFINIMKGLIAGFFSALPFIHIKHLNRLLQRNEDEGFENYFSDNLPYLISFSFSLAMFFYIPVNMLITKYHTGIYAGMAVMILFFLANEVYHFLKEGFFKKKHLIASGIIFAVSFSLMIAFPYIKFKAPIEKSITPFIILFITIIGSFITSFSDLSGSTVFFFITQYLAYSDYLRDTLYEGMKSNLFLIIIFFIGIFVGNTFYRFFEKYLKPLKREQHSLNIGIYFAGFIIICAKYIKAPFFFESETITLLAQKIILFTTIFAFFIIGLVLTFTDYPFYNRTMPPEKKKGRRR